MKRYLILGVLVLMTGQAVAAMAPWFRWESQADGRLVCAQQAPGEGWRRFAGPFNNAGCRP